MKYTEQELTLIRKMIWENAYELFLNYNLSDNKKSIIKRHKKFINSFGISWGTKKFKSLQILNTFLNSKNKALACQQFNNSIIKKIR